MASSYELKVEQILKKVGVKYEKEVPIKQLHGKSLVPLRFDFKVYRYNGHYFFIEVDGEYHFKPIRGKLLYQRQKAYDGKKDAYCLSHNIRLVRIPYWEIPNLTWEKIVNTPYFVVREKYHNNFLTPPY